MRKQILLTALFGCWMAAAHAQTDETMRTYKAAVQMVQAGRYAQAKTDLGKVIQQGGALAPYAHYYYALAAYREKNFAQSRLLIRQLQSRFPDWPKQDDANYLLGISLLEEAQYEEGLRTLQRIANPTVRKDAAAAEQAIMPRLTNVRQLKQLNQKFPDDAVVAHTLIDGIRRNPNSAPADQVLADQLVRKFGVPGTPTAGSIGTPANNANTTRPNANNRPNRNRNSGYNIALLFPFRVSDFDDDRRTRSNQYIYDMLNGMQMARDQLQKEGIKVNLLAYDIDNDANKTLELISNPAFLQTDLMIGPLYLEPNKIATSFSAEKGIPLVNPIATGSDLIANQPMAFLARPSVDQQVQQTFEQARQVSKGQRTAAIYFGATRKDSLMAQAYRDLLEKQNYQVLDFRRIGTTLQATADALFTSPGVSSNSPSSSTVATSVVTVPPIGHIFLSSSSDADGSRLLDALSRRRVSGPLLATSAAFDYYKNGGSTFTRRELYLIYPDFQDESRQEVFDFEQQYLSRRNTIPSVYASQGYDMILFFGRQLAKNGFQNQKTMRDNTDDYILSGFDYTESNDNRVMPIVRFQNGRFVKIN